MPSISLDRRGVTASTPSPLNKSAPARLRPAEISLIAVFSTLILGVMVFCLYRFCPGKAWRRRGRKVDQQQHTTEVKQTFLNLDDEKPAAKSQTPATEVKQTFLYLDGEKSGSEKNGLGIDMRLATKSSKVHPKGEYSFDRNQSLDSTSSSAPLIKNFQALPVSPDLVYSPQDYSPREYSPRTPPPVPGSSREVRLSPKRSRPLPTPMQPLMRSPDQRSRYDISPLQSFTALPSRSQLPMSFLVELDTKREDQTGRRTVSPLQNPSTPFQERKLSESQLSSRNVSPISAPSTTPVVTHPSATPVYLPRPISKYNPYRPALEPAVSKNWPLDNFPIPEHTAVSNPPEGFLSPVRGHLFPAPLRPGGSTSRSPTPTSGRPDATSPIPGSNATVSRVTENPTITHPELDNLFLEEFHRHRRRQQQKAKEEAAKQKREKPGSRKIAALRPAKRLPRGEGRGIPPPTPKKDTVETILGVARSRSAIRKAAEAAASDTVDSVTTTPQPAATTASASIKHTPVVIDDNGSPIKTRKTKKRKTVKAGQSVTSSTGGGSKQEEKGSKRSRGDGGGLLGLLPPRLPSKSRKPSQTPDAYEKARRISGLHELVGSGSTTTSKNSSGSGSVLGQDESPAGFTWARRNG